MDLKRKVIAPEFVSLESLMEDNPNCITEQTSIDPMEYLIICEELESNQNASIELI